MRQTNLKIEKLLEEEADTLKISALIKEDITTYLNSLEIIFESKQGKDFLVKHTKAIDEFVKLMFTSALRQFFGDYLPMQNSLPLTLIAMGSYGREELCVYSDIDLMFVYKDIRGYNVKPIIEAILHLAWDSGLKLGHRVHEVGELLEASLQDMTIKTAMIESRYLCGSKFLWIEAQNELQKIRNFKRKLFLQDKIKVFNKRKEKYPLTMEPNIKEGAGGLRDAHTLFWIANIIFQVEKLADLTPDIIDENEFRELRIAIEFIYRLRSALHLQAGKKQDVLILEYIPSVAKKLGFKDKPLQSAQVALAKQTLKSLWTIKTTSQIYIKKITASILYDAKNVALFKHSYIGNGFYLCKGVLYVSFHKRADTLLTVLRVFSKFEDIKMEFDISVIHYIKRTKIPKQNSSTVYETFSKMFHKKYLNQFLYAFYKSGILANIIKPLKHAINLPQFDGYHIYPVDIHSLKCVWHLENIQDKFIRELFNELNQEHKALLRLAILLHDIGKGKRGNHSKIGAKIFKGYAKKLGFSEHLIAIGDRLISHHTLMSNVALRQDIYSEKVIFSFLAALKNPNILKLLYIVTYCDINSVGKNRYSNFIAKLLRELYDISLKAFSQDKLIGEATRRRRREQALLNNRAFLSLSEIKRKKMMNISSNLFFIKYTSGEIIKIANWAFETENISYKIEVKDSLTITILSCKDVVLSYLLQKLSFLSVVQMEIFELFDKYKYFKIEFSQTLDASEVGYIGGLIEQSIEETLKEPRKKPTIYPDEIILNCKHSKTYAAILLNANDQQGLLAYVIYIFEKFNLKISTAKIQTIKNRTRNLFLIEKQGILCKNSKEVLGFLTESTKKA